MAHHILSKLLLLSLWLFGQALAKSTILSRPCEVHFTGFVACEVIPNQSSAKFFIAESASSQANIIANPLIGQDGIFSATFPMEPGQFLIIQFTEELGLKDFVKQLTTTTERRYNWAERFQGCRIGPIIEESNCIATKVITQGDGLNVRNIPSVSGSIIKRIPRGAEFYIDPTYSSLDSHILEPIDDDYAFVHYNEVWVKLCGEEGYVCAAYAQGQGAGERKRRKITEIEFEVTEPVTIYGDDNGVPGEQVIGSLSRNQTVTPLASFRKDYGNKSGIYFLQVTLGGVRAEILGWVPCLIEENMIIVQ